MAEVADDATTGVVTMVIPAVSMPPHIPSWLSLP
jgi:hypothetical protein